jgi:hypothetical protein
MGARAEYSLDGEELPLPPILVAGGHLDVQRWFENFLAHQPGIFARKLCGYNAASRNHAAIAIWTRSSFVKV